MTDVTPGMIAAWRTNYGLDVRTPEEAMRWWDANYAGMCPAGAVAALGLCLEEIARLTDEREFHRRHVVEMKDVLRRGGWVECDIPACNCGSWHHRYGLPERWREICDALIVADVLDNSTGNKPLRAIQRLTYERDEWRDADQAECALNARLRAECAEMQGERDAAELSRDAAHAECGRITAERDGLASVCNDFQRELGELRQRLAECERALSAATGWPRASARGRHDP